MGGDSSEEGGNCKGGKGGCKDETDAAVKIQAISRGRAGRKNLINSNLVIEENLDAEPGHEAKSAAAVKIQSISRGRADRARLEKHIEGQKQAGSNNDAELDAEF